MKEKEREQRLFLERLDGLVREGEAKAEGVEERIRQNVIDTFRRMYAVLLDAAWTGEGPRDVLHLDRSLPAAEGTVRAFEAFMDELGERWSHRRAKDERFGREIEAGKAAAQLAALDEVRSAWGRFREGGRP